MDTKMLWEIIELFFIMLVVATIAYAPLGYYINCYTRGDEEPFGETNPHGDSPSVVNDIAETAIHFIKTKLGKK